MEIPAFEREWHGIAFDRVGTPDAGRRADAGFYGAFYALLSEEGSAPDPAWVRAKQNLAEWVEGAVLRPLAARRPAILSLGAGLGVMEELWLARGYQVAVQECQPHSLRGLRERHPDVQVFLGDASHVEAPDGAFEAVVLSAIDYIYSRAEYSELLAEVARLLRPGGVAVMVSVSNLSVRGILRSLARAAVAWARPRDRSALMWGWKRTLSVHLRLGRRHGLRAELVCAFDDEFRPRAERRPAFAWTRPVSGSKTAVVWSRR